MRKLFLPILFLLLVITVSFAQKPIKIVFYNVENLFDTINDPEIRDDEFTPQGPKKWNTAKYKKKLSNLERVFYDIASIDKDFPVAIGLAEIENRNVLEDIVTCPKLAPANYRIVHYDSPDARGVDVAMLYRPDIFKLQGSEAVKTVIPERPTFKTRDILTAWGTIDGEPVYFMVIHWPSRLGGKEQSEYLRVAVAKQMHAIADSVMRADDDTRVIIMGDFNDDPTDKSMAQALGAKGRIKDLKEGDLFNPFTEMLKAGYGTLAYGDAWNIFDNIIVSANMVLDDDGLLLEKAPKAKFYGNIFKQSYMVQKEGQYKGYPLRTYIGNNFQGGFSDHFPVYINIKYVKD